MTPSIKHQLFLSHSPEAVWEYLTNAALMELWLMKTDFQPILNREFKFTINPMPNLEFDGIVYCKVLEIIPFKKLSYSWQLGPGDGTLNVDSVVRWELRPKENGTELLLDHGDFVIMKNLGMFNSMNEGWYQCVRKIADNLNAKDHGTTNS